MKYKEIRKLSRAMMAVLACITLPACEDDLEKHATPSGMMTFQVGVPDGWSSGMTVSKTAPDTHCTAVDSADYNGATPLYIHTIEADNGVTPEKHQSHKRGNPVADIDGFYDKFSLSGVCYTGTYPDKEEDNKWTPEYAFNLTYNKNGSPADESSALYWPSQGQVRFFAFAPLTADGGAKWAGSQTTAGSPVVSYTVPAAIEKQLDLMTVCQDATGSSLSNGSIGLNFKHALTAVRIAVGNDMLAGTIHKVTISGVHGSGTHIPGSGIWQTSDTANISYSITKDIKISADQTSNDNAHAKPGQEVSGYKDDGLMFLLMPQTLEKDAALTIEFTDDLSKTRRTITGSLSGKEWKAGKIVTYVLSPSSINLKVCIENFSKKSASDVTATEPIDTIPYTGVWYDIKFKSYVEVTQPGKETKKVYAPLKMQYAIGESENSSWTDITWKDGNADPTSETGNTDQEYSGTFIFENAQAKGFKTLREKLTQRTSSIGTAEAPHYLPDDTGQETANCYMIAQPGYYELPLVYGNAIGKGGTTNESAYTHTHKTQEEDPAATTFREPGLKYYADYKEQPITGPHILNARGATLLWQDSPDLVDDVKLNANGRLQFRIRPHSITQGNAIVAVTDANNDIIWSWHIWVTYRRNEWEASNLVTRSSSDPDTEFTLTTCNLGYCDPHPTTDEKQTIRIKFSFPSIGNKHGGKELSVIKEFTQMEFKGSAAGDNTYYQWGRKDPMLPGIYNEQSPAYTGFENELNMENKQYFQYDSRYRFTKSPETQGVSIGYATQHPYFFIMSRNNTKIGVYAPRRHWHTQTNQPYIAATTKSLYSLWNSNAIKGSGASDNQTVTKTVYDPCPAGFHVPPIAAFTSISGSGAYGTANACAGKGWPKYDAEKHTWTMKCQVTDDSPLIEFPPTGVRNMAKEQLATQEEDDKKYGGLPDNFRYGTVPAFKEITYFAASSVDNTTAGQAIIFYIDGRQEYIDKNGGEIGTASNGGSNNSYGFTIRPAKD